MSSATASDIVALRGLGPKSAAWLAAAGIDSVADLEAQGAVAAYLAVRRAGFEPSLNLLWALQGAIMDIHWTDVPASIKAQLKQALAEAAR
jgi:hypothetical protein